MTTPRAVAVAALALFVAASAAGQIRVVDDAGTSVALAAPARRILTLAPHAAELVFAAGAGNRIVGTVKGTDYPPAARRIPVIGDVTALDLERIAVLAPDLIVTWPWTTPAQVALLRERGIAVFEANAQGIDGIATDIERIGELAGTGADASVAATALRRRIAELDGEAGEGSRLRVFYQVSGAPLFTLGGLHLVSQAIARCGGENVFASLTIPAPEVGIEAVLAANPQVIIAGTAGARRPPWLDAWSRWPALDAVRAHNLFAVDADLLHRPGPRFVDGVAQLCRTMREARRRIAAEAYNLRSGAASGGTK